MDIDQCVLPPAQAAALPAPKASMAAAVTATRPMCRKNFGVMSYLSFWGEPSKNCNENESFWFFLFHFHFIHAVNSCFFVNLDDQIIIVSAHVEGIKQRWKQVIPIEVFGFYRHGVPVIK